MDLVKPQVYIIGRNDLDIETFSNFLTEINSLDYLDNYSVGDEASKLTEIYGKLCYKSFVPNVNPNVTKVRDDNKKFMENILKSGHGSVLEHATVNLIFHNVSRVFTHELVRHRTGCAYSQESLRYVRLDKIKFWLPPEVEQDEFLFIKFKNHIEQTEKTINEIFKYLNLDNKPFEEKKMWTSTVRRLAPIGLATTIGCTMNHRALRHIIELRTSKHAEIEIRIVFLELAKQLQSMFPHMYQDMTIEDDGQCIFENKKV